jgi:hypothetical protein
MAAMPLIVTGVKNDGFPKIPDYRKMAVEVEFGNVRKDVTDYIVIDRPGIKDLH